MTAIYAHTAADGAVWGSSCSAPPARLAESVAAFSAQVSGAAVFVLGEAVNAELICRLYARGGTLYLGGAVAAGVTAADPPAVITYRMRQLALPASLGGWHQAVDVDVAVYAMLCELQAGRPGAAVAALLRHRLWAHLSFIETIDAFAALRLVTSLCDPRWYVDAQRPDRSSRFRRYLGLHPAAMAAALAQAPATGAAARCRAALQTWRGGPGWATGVQSDAPGNFLWRSYFADRCDDRIPEHVAWLRASSRFASYLRHGWLAVIYRGQGYVGDRSLFLPEAFFRTEDEIAGYRRHVADFVPGV